VPLQAYLPQDRRHALARGLELPLRCTGAALFSDITGFTSLTETLAQASGQRRGVDELARRINAVHEVLIAEVERRHGSVVAFAGDGMTCWFDDATAAAAAPAAARAAACAAAMQRAMRRFPELSIKVGVGAGEALRVAVGDPAIQRIDLLAGATVARAVAAEGLAEAGEIVLDDSAAAALGPGATTPHEAPHGAGFHRCAAEAVPVDDPPRAAPGSDATPDPQLRPWVLPFVYERETASGGLFATDLRPATALFVRVALGQTTPAAPGEAAAQAQALDDLVALVQRTVAPRGGVLLEVQVDAHGTCLYANFGAAQVHEDDPQRALRTALALRDALAAAGTPARMGLASGTLCVGGYGGAGRRSFGAIGDAVNAAARLMGLAAADEVLVAGRVRQPQADEEFTFEARPPIAVKGKAEPIAVFAATGVQRRRSIRLQEPVSALPLVGRETATARLSAAVAAVLEGRGQLLRIVGEAGIGKSRLLAEGVRIARRAGLVGCGGACRLDGLRVPYQVWHGVWTAFFDLDPALPQRRLRQAAQAALQRLVPAQAEAWPLLGAVLGQDWPDTPLTAALQPKDRKSLLHAVLRQCLAAAAAEAAEDGMGLLLVLEDLHAADALSLELLAEITRAIAALPVLVLSTERRPEAHARPDAPANDAPEAQPALEHVAVIELRGLAAADVAHIVRAKLAQRFPEQVAPVPAALLERIAARAQGNPFFVEELLDYLHDRGIDPRRLDTGADAALALPNSLHSLVLSRIDRLPARQQAPLKAASVIGREFGAAELQAYCPELGDAAQVAGEVDALGRLGFTPRLPGPGDGRHVFRHLVTHEVAYESIALDTRARLHAQYLRHLDQQHAGSDAPPPAALLAHHGVRAERAIGRERACRYLRLAGEQAAARFANDEALAHFARALQWLPADDPATRFELLLQRQAVLDLQGRHDAQRADLDAADELAARLPDAALRRARIAVLRAKLETELGRYAAGRQQAGDAIALLAGAAGPAAQALRLKAALQQAEVMLHVGEAAAARPLLEDALASARAQGLDGAQAAALSSLGHVHWRLGGFEQAARCYDDALALARRGTDLRLQLNLLNGLGVVAKSRSRFAEAARHYAQALETARRIGDRSGEAMLLNNLGSAWLAAGRFHDALVHGGQAAAIFEQTGETVLHGLALANCGEAQRELGRPAPALALGTQALAVLRAAGSRPGEALVLENLGLAEAAAGRLDAAEARLRAAVSLAREIGSPAREASALLHLGQVLAARGDAGAAPVLAEAAARAAPLGDEALVLEIDAAQAMAQALSGRDPAAGLQRLERLLPRLLAGPAEADEAAEAAETPGLPLALYATALAVLRAGRDPRAPALHERSRRELAARAARIPDGELRRDFLAVAEHRTILDEPDDER
jgi:predicted ATPase/class 3 adenylate cyclase